MRCPYCTNTDSKVIDSRDVNGSVRRRRECLRCGLRFTTYERVEAVSLLIIKKDGRREEYNRGKLSTGIHKACEKRPLPTGTIDQIVDEIEAALFHMGKAEVPSSVVGEMVMERLKELDHIAYIRFASVYRPFADLESLKAELNALESRRPTPARGGAGQLPLLPVIESTNGTKPRSRGRRVREKSHA